MNYYKIKYLNDSFKIVKARDSLDVIKKYDLATKGWSRKQGYQYLYDK